MRKAARNDLGDNFFNYIYYCSNVKTNNCLAVNILERQEVDHIR